MVKGKENNSHISYIGTKGVPAKYGGAETGVQEISSRLVKKHYSINVYGSHNKKGIKRSDFKGIKTINFPSLKSKGLDFLFLRIFSTLFASFNRETKILHYYGCDAGLYYLIPKLLRKKIVITLDGFEWERESYSKIEKIFLKLIFRITVKRAHHVIVDSQIFLNWLADKYKISSSFLPYAANFNRDINEQMLKKYDLKKNDYIIFIGRLVQEKGVDLLLKAFRNLKTEKKLVIVGDNPYDEKYVNYLKSLASTNVVFLGAIYGSEYEELLKCAYCYTSASKVEGTSPSLVQAMAYGLATVVSDIPTNVEVLNGTGLTFRNEDYDDLRSKLEILLRDEVLAQDFGEKASQRAAQHYSWDAVVNKLDKIYKNLLDS